MIFLALGSNLGDRKANLKKALELLQEAVGSPEFYCTEMLETEAIGFAGGDFLNQIVAFEYDCTPEEMLRICQKIEIEMGREAHKAEYDNEGKRVYRDRIIDIDILFFNDMIVNTEELEIPHPQIFTRPFVKQLLMSYPDEIKNNFL